MFTLSARLHKILKKQGSLLESTISFVFYSNPQLCLDLDGKLGLDLHSRKIVKTGVGLLRLPSAASGCRLSGGGLASDIHNIYDTLHWVETKHWRFFCFGIRSAIFWHMKTGTFGFWLMMREYRMYFGLPPCCWFGLSIRPLSMRAF